MGAEVTNSDQTAIIDGFNDDAKAHRTTPINSLIDFQYDSFQVDSTTQATKDIFTFYLFDQINGIDNLQGTIEITYLTAEKTQISAGRRLL
jgi:hypothetical protein